MRVKLFSRKIIVRLKLSKREEKINIMLKYKGYIGHFRFDEIKSIFYGQVANIHDPILFQGESVEEVRVAFQDAIDRHLVGREKYDEWGF